MNILLLGGTAFLGREIARSFLSSGHTVTCVARGSAPAPVGATLAKVDRDEDDALRPVSGRTWDVVIDLAINPGHAKRATQQLHTGHWIYVSSGSVYATFPAGGATEAEDIHAPLSAEAMTDMSQYGLAKVACENAYREHGEALTIMRPGLIGGDGDWTGRSGYYPWRFAHPTGDDVVVPDETQPTAILDVKDLAAWIVYCVTKRITGTFNAAGEATTLRHIYRVCQDITKSEVAPRIIDNATFLNYGVQPWAWPRSLPLWIPDPTLRHMSTLDCGKARVQGFTLSLIHI